MQHVTTSSACSDSLRTSKDALSQLSRAASALGPYRTRDELIPYVSDPAEDDDELLLELAKQLGLQLAAVGGSAYAHTLLKPLENLAASDENSVRAESVRSMQKVVEGMAAVDVEAQFLPMLTRLAHGCYPARIAACALYPNVHPTVAEAEQAALREEFVALAGDSHPVVRRAAGANLARFAEAAGPEHLETFLRLFVKISQDSAPRS